MARSIFQIEQGYVGFALVGATDPDAWNAPTGVGVEAATISLYETESAQGWTCQVTSAQLTAEANENDVDVPATFCAPASTTPQPGETSYSLEMEWLQDPQIVNGLSRFLFEHDTETAYFYLGLAQDSPPKAIGRVKLLAGAFGGTARENLTAEASLGLVRKPQILFGDATASEAVPPTPTAPV